MKAMLLAAGLGQRMLPLTLERAKPTLPFLNRPLLLRQLDHLEAAGVHRVVVNVHHRPETVLALLAAAANETTAPAGSAPAVEEGRAFRIGGLEVRVSPEKERLGTSGALRHAAAHLEGDEPFFCVNSDMFSEIDLRAALATHVRRGAEATMVLTGDGGEGFTPVHHDGERVRAFGDPPAGEKTGEPGIFTGIHVIEPALLERLPEGASDFLPALYRPMIAAGRGPAVHLAGERWFEVGSPARYRDSQAKALEQPLGAGHRQPEPPDSALGRACGADIGRNTLWGERCHIGWGSIIGEGTILGDDVLVEEAVRLSRSVLLDGARAGAGCILDRVIVGAGTAVPAGEILSDALLQATGESHGDPASAGPAHRWQGMWRVDL